MAVYKIDSIRFPFRVGFLIAQEVKRRGFPWTFKSVVVDIVTKFFKDDLVKPWEPEEKRRIFEQLDKGEVEPWDIY